jgi:hypothetical protein
MTKSLNRSTRLCLILVLIIGLIPKVARADDGDKNRPIRLHATAAFGPIGTVYSLGGVLINGHSAYGDQIIWGGELLQVSDGASASVSLDSIGQVMLTRGTTLRLSARLVSSDEKTNGRVLIVSLIEGDINVQLQQGASAYIETCGSAFTATDEASFRIEIRGGQAAIKVIGGTVRTESPVTRRIYETQPVKPPTVAKVKPGSQTDVSAKAVSKSRQERGQLVAFRLNSGQANVQWVDEGLQEGKKVEFKLSDPTIGQFTPSDVAITNSQGIATVFFVAGRNRGLAEVTATVIDLIDNDDLKETAVPGIVARIEVVKPRFWTKKKILIIAAAAAAIGICVVKCDNKKPLQQVPPPTIP